MRRRAAGPGRGRTGALPGALLAALLLSLLAAAPATAAPAVAPLPQAAAPGRPGASARPDTVRLLLPAPGDWPRPERFAIAPDSVLFGGEVELVLGFAPGTPRPEPDEPGEGSAELPWAGAARWLPETPDGPEMRLPARVLAPGVLVLTWGEGGPEAGCRAGSRLADGQGPAPLRPLPPLAGWRLWLLLLLALLAAGLALGALAVARAARGRPADDRPLPPPPHLATAIALLALLRSGLLESGRARAFLDRFCGVLREFLAARYGIAARCLAAAELQPALLERGHRASAARGLADLLAAAELLRYRPQPADAGACREMLAEAVALVAEARFEPLFTPAPPELVRDGRRAWYELVEAVAPWKRSPVAVPAAGRR